MNLLLTYIVHTMPAMWTGIHIRLMGIYKRRSSDPDYIIGYHPKYCQDHLLVHRIFRITLQTMTIYANLQMLDIIELRPISNHVHYLLHELAIVLQIMNSGVYMEP